MKVKLLNPKKRKKSQWMKGFVITPKESDIESVERERIRDFVANRYRK